MYTLKGKAKEETTVKNLNEKMKIYRLPGTATNEGLGCGRNTMVDFGNKVLLAGYIYGGPKVNDYCAAVYEHTTADKSCEDEIRLMAIRDEHYEEAGHVPQWAMIH